MAPRASIEKARWRELSFSSNERAGKMKESAITMMIIERTSISLMRLPIFDCWFLRRLPWGLRFF